MRNKILIGIIIFVGLSISGLSQTDENAALEAMKTALENIIKKPVTELRGIYTKDEIEQKLVAIKTELNDKCTKIDKTWTDEISKDLDKFVTELKTVKDRDLKKKITGFSNTLSQKLKNRVNAINKNIQDNKRKAEEVERKAVLTEIRNSISVNIKATAHVIRQVKVVLALAGLILIIALISLFLLYFVLFKRLKDVENSLDNAVKNMLSGVNYIANKVIPDLGKKIENGFNIMKTTEDENARQTILLIKDNNMEILNRLSRTESQEFPGEYNNYEKSAAKVETKKRWKTAPLESEVDRWLESEIDIPLINIDFPGDSTGNLWRDEIIDSFKKNKPFIISWIEENEKNGGEVKNWIENIGRIIMEGAEYNEESFFEKIYQDIKTTRKRLSENEFETLRPYFFDPLLTALRIEEFGRPEERYEPGKHNPISGSPGAGIILIRKVNFPGYKVKYSDKILFKAQVEL